MVVINVVGFPYKLKLRTGDIVVPSDGQPHWVPDEVAESKFDNVFRIIVPPVNKNTVSIYKPPVVETKKENNIIEIQIEEEKPKSIVQKNIEENKPPLTGIKIKKNTREKLIKKGAPRIKKEEVTDGNNLYYFMGLYEKLYIG